MKQTFEEQVKFFREWLDECEKLGASVQFEHRNYGTRTWCTAAYGSPWFSNKTEFRLKSKTININGVELVAPRLSKNTSKKFVYLYSSVTNLIEEVREDFINNGCVVFYTSEDAEAFYRAVGVIK